MYCEKCGQEIPDNAVFCGKCGTKVRNTPPEETIAEQTTTESRELTRKLKKRQWRMILQVFVGLVLLAAIIIGCYSVIHRIRSRVVPMNEAKVGNTVIFGSFEQDNDSGNGAEPIEWIVLDKQDDQLLLLSKKILDRRNYYGSYYPVTWEESHLRFWLNNVFYETAFTEAEQQLIQQTEVLNEDNSKYETEGGNDTNDYVFLLSIREVKEHIPFPWNRRAEETMYAEEKDIGYSYGKRSKYADWWLRSPGTDAKYAAYVDNYGGVYGRGHNVSNGLVGVRPALWVSVE
ncbi:MAG: DUF6273 domain-containing protein [Lachnospiraceae bacterium]|nr:DUF6273 domain-containing protein [Lachnospiraceae bacterium]